MTNFIEKTVSFTDGRISGEKLVHADSLKDVFKKICYNVFAKPIEGCQVSYDATNEQAILTGKGMKITINAVSKKEFINAKKA